MADKSVMQDINSASPAAGIPYDPFSGARALSRIKPGIEREVSYRQYASFSGNFSHGTGKKSEWRTKP
jgi:hypothetical protein